jgi:hypothetical protein
MASRARNALSGHSKKAGSKVALDQANRSDREGLSFSRPSSSFYEPNTYAGRVVLIDENNTCFLKRRFNPYQS